MRDVHLILLLTMASAEKRKRSQALRNLTRNLNKLTELIDDKSPLVKVIPLR